MSNKIKHSKVRNTGILFELITRQITADIIENKDGLAVGLLKKYFSPNTQLGKEYELYKVLTTENYKSENKANHLIDAVLKTYNKINRSQLRREKYNLVSEIKNSYSVDQFFMARIPNYKVYASIYKLFESLTTTDPSTETNSKFTIIESITKKKRKHLKTESKTLETYKKSEKDLRLLTYQVLVEKFNKKYKTLSEQQKALLRKYINNISNTNQLKEFVEKESIIEAPVKKTRTRRPNKKKVEKNSSVVSFESQSAQKKQKVDTFSVVQSSADKDTSKIFSTTQVFRPIQITYPLASEQPVKNESQERAPDEKS